jgi:hypothetical protein
MNGGLAMTWQVGLVGEAMDVGELERLAASCGCAIITDADGRPCLIGPQFDALASYDEVRKLACNMLVVLNALAMQHHSDHRPIQVGYGITQVHSDGKRDIAVSIHETVRVRDWIDANVIRADGSTEGVTTRADQNAEHYQRVLDDPKLFGVTEVLAGDLTWQRMRVALERVTALIGKSGKDYDAIAASNYATRDEIRRLKANIEDPRLAGINALHAFPSGPERAKLCLEDARALILRIFWAYVGQTR